MESEREGFFHLAGVVVAEVGPVSAPSCWFSNSTSCCSRSISMIKGTMRMRKAVPAIHAAFPAR